MITAGQAWRTAGGLQAEKMAKLEELRVKKRAEREAREKEEAKEKEKARWEEDHFI